MDELRADPAVLAELGTMPAKFRKIFNERQLAILRLTQPGHPGSSVVHDASRKFVLGVYTHVVSSLSPCFEVPPLTRLSRRS